MKTNESLSRFGKVRGKSEKKKGGKKIIKRKWRWKVEVGQGSEKDPG